VTIERRSRPSLLPGALHKIGEDNSAPARHYPGSIPYPVTHRPKYACRSCEGTVVQAPAVERLICRRPARLKPWSPSVLVNKYADIIRSTVNLRRWHRQGILIDRSTLAFWVGYAAAELRPLWSLMRDELLTSTRLFVDETTAPVLIQGEVDQDRIHVGDRPRSATMGRDRSHRGSFHLRAWARACFTPSIGLRNFSGVIQCDGMAPTKPWPNRRGNDVTLSHCWSHVRESSSILSKDGLTPIASEAPAIAQFYASRRTSAVDRRKNGWPSASLGPNPDPRR